MPRISNESKVLDYLKYENLLNAIATEEAFVEGPVDLCMWCFQMDGEFYEQFTVAHPPYEDQDPLYRCFICRDTLGEPDN